MTGEGGSICGSGPPRQRAVADRGALGRLTLPWYVRTDVAGRVVENISSEARVARAVTVAEIAEASSDHPILSHPHPDPRYDGWTHEERIEHYIERFLAAEETVEVVVEAWEVGDDLLLRDGCHRACALHRVADRVSWRFEVLVGQPAPGNPEAAVVSEARVAAGVETRG